MSSNTYFIWGGDTLADRNRDIGNNSRAIDQALRFKDTPVRSLISAC